MRNMSIEEITNMSIEEITNMTKEEAEKTALLEHDVNYETHLVPIYIVVKTDKEGRVSRHTYPSCVPMGVTLSEATFNKN